MAKLVYACEYCGQAFSSREEAVRHEQTHSHRCENLHCGILFRTKRKGQKYCSSVCKERAKQQRWRDRHKAMKNTEEMR